MSARQVLSDAIEAGVEIILTDPVTLRLSSSRQPPQTLLTSIMAYKPEIIKLLRLQAPPQPEVVSDGQRQKVLAPRTRARVCRTTVSSMTMYDQPGLAADAPIALALNDPGDAGLEWHGEYEPAEPHPSRTACKHCGERINWQTDGLAFADGSVAHIRCYERAASKGPVF